LKFSIKRHLEREVFKRKDKNFPTLFSLFTLMASVEAPSSLPCSETSRRRYSDTAVQPCFRKEKIEEMKKRVSVSKFLVIGRLEAKKKPREISREK